MREPGNHRSPGIPRAPVDTARLFFAVDITDDARLTLSPWIENARASAPELAREIRWTRPENLHVTLKFLGETPVSDIDGIIEAVSPGIAQADPEWCQVDGIGAFKVGRGAVLRAEINKGRALAGLAGKLEAVLENRGYPRERRSWMPGSRHFYSHVTLARSRSPHAARTALGLLASIPPDVTFRADSVLLYRSELRPAGPSYTVVARFPMQGLSEATHHRTLDSV